MLTSTSSSTAAEDERVVAAATLAAAEEQLQSLTARHAGTFVQAERRARSFQEGLQDLLQQLSSTTINLPVIDESTAQKISDLSEQHRIRRRTLLQHGSLLELLELPALMDACVRSQLYEEALQIAAFANTLQRRHPDNKQQPSLTAVHTVIAQIRSRQVDLRWHLLQRLRHAVTMPECLETVTSVRRLHQIELEERTAAPTGLERAHAALEYQLQIDFLEARDVWVEQPSSNEFAGATSAADGGHPLSSRLLHQASGGTMGEEALLDTIERYRTRMFEVATQFNAIFRASANTSSSSSSSTNATTGESATTTLLSLWMARRVQRFLQLLQSQLMLQQQQQPQRPLDAADLRDVLEASVFFATSLGRLGADFTPQLAPIFEPVLVQIVTQYWKDGVAQLHETLTICRDAGVAGPLTAEISEETDVAGSEQQPQDGLLTTAIPLDQPQPAPKKLLALPPLARLVNAVLQGLNELRRCLLPTVFPTLRRRLDQDVLQTVRQLLLTHERAVAVPGLAGEAIRLRESALALRETFGQCVEPYLQGSLEAAVGNAALASQYHQTVRDYCWQQQQLVIAKQQQQQQAELDAAASSADQEENQAGEEEGEGESEDETKVASAEATPTSIEVNESESGEGMVDDADDHE